MNFACGATRRAAVCAALAMPGFLAAAGTVEAGATRSGGIVMPVSGKVGRDPANDERIVVGEQSKWFVWFWCQKANGDYVKEKVRVKLSGYPKGRGEAAPTFEPKRVLTTDNPSNPAAESMSLVTVDTKYFKNKQSTRPGLYSLHFTAKGKECPTYDAGAARVLVVPKITRAPADNGKQKDVVWWFGNAEPGPLTDLGYTLKLELTAHGEDKKYLWKITQGGDYAQFVGGGTEKTTSTNKVKVQVHKNVKKRDDLPKNTGDFRVTVTVNDATSDPVKLRVKRPYDAKFLPPPDDEDHAGHGYKSVLFYLVRDQFGKAMPKKMPVREHFTGPTVDDHPDTNWVRAHEGGAITKLSGAIQDKITGQSFVQLPRPGPRGPQSPLGRTPIIHWPGEVWIGSTKVRGVKIMTLVWQRFRDHARHCNISSPPEKKPTCSCKKLRKTGECP